MFIDFVDVEKLSRQSGVPNNFYFNNINKHLISDNHFGTENSRGKNNHFGIYRGSNLDSSIYAQNYLSEKERNSLCKFCETFQP